jgi:uncharacterized membrane protein YuzA (DUF378 family)
MKHSNYVYLRVKIHMILTALVLIGAINWGTTALGYNLVEILNSQVNSLLGTQTHINKVIYLLVAIAAIHLALKKKTWLPFLGYTAFPSAAFVPNKVNKNASIKVDVEVKPNTRVAYWASKNIQGKVPDVEKAYDDFSNSGVVMSNSNGIATLEIEPSTSYIIPSGREIPKHIHYRMLDLPSGMMSDVRTVYY